MRRERDETSGGKQKHKHKMGNATRCCRPQVHDIHELRDIEISLQNARDAKNSTKYIKFFMMDLTNTLDSALFMAKMKVCFMRKISDLI
jgi:hypothetical protein